MVWLFIVLAFFEGSSVATSIRGEALYLNPAGLGIREGVEVYLRNAYTEEGFTKDSKISFLIKNFAVGYDRKSESFIYGSGSVIGGLLAVGISYTSKLDEVKGGFILRPHPLLSIGGTVTNVNKMNTYRAGIALKPLLKSLTLYGDVIFKDTVESYVYGLGLNPVEGLNIYLQGGRDGKLSIGLDISLGKVRTGTSYNMDDDRGYVDLVLSRELYPLIYRENKFVEVAIGGDYSDEKTTSFFYRRKNFGELILNLKKIEELDDVRGVLLKLENNNLGFARAEEVRTQLERLKKKGKKVYVYGDTYSILNYYIASVGDRVFLHPVGSVMFPGLYIGKVYIKGLLDKLGIEFETARVGKFKSAVEPLIRKDMSREDSLQLARILEVAFSELKEKVVEGRGLSEDSLMALIDSLGYFNADVAYSSGLVDTLLDYKGLKSLIKKEEHVKLVSLVDITRREVDLDFPITKPRIAVLTAEGTIVEGKSGYSLFPILGGKYVGHKTIEQLCERLEKDKSIKAVVLRVNSPGGSGFASEAMLRVLKELNRKKPVIVSMGNVAASGGYYISSIGTTIFADKTTITGSIGVLGTKPVLKKFYEKIGLTSDYLKVGRHSDAFSTWRPLSERERELFQKEIEWFYGKFLDRVSEARGMPRDSVHQIAQGRVWTGLDAKRIGLVDRNGGLIEAIEEAKKRAGIVGDVDIVFVREKRKFPFSIFGTTELELSAPPLIKGDGPLYIAPYILRIH